MKLRMGIVPVTQFASQAYSLIFLASLFFLWAHRQAMFSHLIENAAALTYVAAMVGAILQLLYLISLGRNRN